MSDHQGITLKSYNLERLENSSSITGFTVSELLDMIVEKHFRDHTNPKTTEETRQRSAGQGANTTPSAADEVFDAESIEDANFDRIGHERSRQKITPWQVKRFENLEVIGCSWGGKNLHNHTLPSILDRALLDFCGKLSHTMDEDLHQIEKHLGLKAKRSHGSGISGRIRMPSTGLSLPKMSDREIVEAAWKAARALSVPFAIVFRLKNADLGMSAGSELEVSFDPNQIVSEQDHEQDEPSVKPGSCIRIRYEDTRETQKIFIKRHPEDAFLDADTVDVADGSPLAMSLLGAQSGDTVSMAVGKRTRDVKILETWAVKGEDAPMSASKPQKKLPRILDMIEAGVISPGEVLRMRDHPGTEAILLADGRVHYQGKKMSLNQWGCQTKGSISIQIYIHAENANGELLHDIRKKMVR